MFKRFFGGLLILAPIFSYAQNIDYTRVRNGPMKADGSYLSFSAACTAAGTAGMSVTITWTALTTQSCANPLTFNGGLLRPANGQTITLSGAITAPLKQIFDTTLGGTISISSTSTPFLYPQWWGAKEDGVTDDSAALNAAIKVAITSAIPLRLPAGTFVANTATNSVILNILDSSNNRGITIMGAGSQKTMIKTATGGADLMAAIATQFANPIYSLEGFTLLGPDYTGTGTCNGTTLSGNGLRISGSVAAPRLLIRDIYSWGFCGSGKAGAWFDGTEDGEIDSLRVTFNDIGLKLTGGFNVNTVNNLMADQNATDGILAQGITGTTFNTPLIQSNSKTGWLCNGCTNLVVNASYWENNNSSHTASTYGLDLSAAGNTVVIGNIFNGGQFQTSGDNIHLFGVAGFLVSNNVFTGGLGTSGPTPLVIIDGPYVLSNSFIGFIGAPAGISTINGAAQQNFICPIQNASGTNGVCQFPSGASIQSNVPINYLADTGSNNAIAATGDLPISVGLTVHVRLAHTLQAGANTFTYNGVTNSISSHYALVGIPTAYSITGTVIEMYWNGSFWLDLSQ